MTVSLKIDNMCKNQKDIMKRVLVNLNEKAKGFTAS